MQSPDAYKAMHKTGDFDLNTASWLKTDLKKLIRKTDFAVFGFCYDTGVGVGLRDANLRDPNYGWRASLRVKKV